MTTSKYATSTTWHKLLSEHGCVLRGYGGVSESISCYYPRYDSRDVLVAVVIVLPFAMKCEQSVCLMAAQGVHRSVRAGGFSIRECFRHDFQVACTLLVDDGEIRDGGGAMVVGRFQFGVSLRSAR